MMEPLIDVGTLAELLDKSESWVRQQAADGRLPAFRLGREWRFKLSAITAWLGDQANEPSTPTPARPPRAVTTSAPQERPPARPELVPAFAETIAASWRPAAGAGEDRQKRSAPAGKAPQQRRRRRSAPRIASIPGAEQSRRTDDAL
jgi:excisionase family DNA binding protein